MDAQEKVKSNLAIQVAAGERMLQAGIPNSIIRALSTEGRLSTPGIASSSEISEWLDGATPEQREMFQAAKVQFHEPLAESLHAVRKMQQAQIPADIIYDVRMSKDADVQAWVGARHEALQDAQNKLRDNKETSGFAIFLGGGFAVAMGIASFVGGLLGWLLVMRKSVLQCSVCSAVVNASQRGGTLYNVTGAAGLIFTIAFPRLRNGRNFHDGSREPTDQIPHFRGALQLNQPGWCYAFLD